MAELPIQQILPKLLEALRQPRIEPFKAIIEAAPGAGKSTQLPLALLQNKLFAGQIIVLQPRRLAALALARYLAESCGEKVGERIGFHVRGEQQQSAQTKLLFMTEGLFVQYLQHDPELKGIDCVIFDEFHERNLAGDLALAMLQESLELRPELALLVMSATLPAATIAKWLETSSIYSCSGREHPVALHYRPVGLQQDYLSHAKSVIQEALQHANTGVLVFLPGQREINRLYEQFEERSDLSVHRLHGQIPLQQQRQVLTASESTEKRLVLATNIAETSLTIPHIDVVVDSGRERSAEFYPQHGVTRLLTRRISLAAATQRAGRAGRTGPGSAYRLWAAADEHGMRAYDPAESERAELSSFLLECKRWGSEPQQLRFLSPPNSAHLAAAEDLLRQLEMSSTTGHLTALGQQVTRYATEPRLARILYAACQAKMDADHYRVTAAWLVAQLEQQTQLAQFPQLLTQCSALVKTRFQQWCKQLQVAPTSAIDEGLIVELLLWGFADRVAQQRGSSARYLAAYGGGLCVHEQSHINRQPWLLVMHVSFTETQKDAYIQQAVSMTEQDLQHPAVHVEEDVSLDWQGSQQRLQLMQRRHIGAITLTESRLDKPVSAAERIHALATYVQELGLQKVTDLPFKWTPAAEQWLARVQLWQSQQADAPDFSLATLQRTISSWAGSYWQQITSLQELQNWSPLAALQALLSYSQQQHLEANYPLTWQAPSGRQHKIDYSGSQPIVAVKLQEVFGTPVSPKLGAGELALTFDLLSPAGRLLQRTQDLAAFWQGAYTAVKKEMRGRYPKHPWPDDPTTAVATHRTKRHLE